MAMCSVCLLEFEARMDPVVGRCGHSLCLPCYGLLPKPQCPICRREGSFQSKRPNFQMCEVLMERKAKEEQWRQKEQTWQNKEKESNARIERLEIEVHMERHVKEHQWRQKELKWQAKEKEYNARIERFESEKAEFDEEKKKRAMQLKQREGEYSSLQLFLSAESKKRQDVESKCREEGRKLAQVRKEMEEAKTTSEAKLAHVKTQLEQSRSQNAAAVRDHRAIVSKKNRELAEATRALTEMRTAAPSTSDAPGPQEPTVTARGGIGLSTVSVDVVPPSVASSHIRITVAFDGPPSAKRPRNEGLAPNMPQSDGFEPQMVPSPLSSSDAEDFGFSHQAASLLPPMTPFPPPLPPSHRYPSRSFTLTNQRPNLDFSFAV